jgi:hypothetical protein
MEKNNKDAQIGYNETYSENEDDDTFDRVTKNKNRIKKIIEEFDESVIQSEIFPN